ncbi:MAG: response regulator [Methylococcaceae bacterium]|nr:response regulator [Methylococcaceae bacterium]
MINKPLAPFDILLLEDEPADAYLVKIALEEGNKPTNLHHVVDGYEGFTFLQQQECYKDAPRPDLILLDMNMPRMSGHEFLMKIKADDAFKSIPIVVLTTSEAEIDILKSYQLGAASYISKPIDVTRFMTMINQLEDYWFTLVCLPVERKL